MRLQFSLRSFLLIVVVVSAFWGTTGTRAIRQKQIVEKVLAAGGIALYDKGAKINSGSLVVHWLHPVNYIVLRPSKELPVDAQLQWITDLHGIESLSIAPVHKHQSGLTDAGAMLIARRFSHLKLLKVEHATCSNSSLRRVRDALKETRGWINRSNGWGSSLQLGRKSAFFSWVDDFKLRDD